MYERVVARRVESEVCFALWGDEFGPAEDFAWFDQFSEYLVTVIEGKPTRPEMLFASAKDPGLAIWSTSTRADGTQGVQEFLKISRGPLPPAMFHPPANYKEVAQPLSPSERSRRPDVDRLGPPGDARPKGGKIVGWAVLMLVVVCGIALLVHSVVLHIAACIVLDRPRFVQALVAAAIIWLVMMVAGLFSLPPVLGLAVSVLAAFAGVKISYGAGIVQTLALFIVCGLIAALATFAGAIFGF
jgi:hypothetical protein